MKQEKLIYLAIPYSWDPKTSFLIANEVTAKLMMEGYIIFSPISHTHHLSEEMPSEYQFDHDFWLNQDLEILRRCDEVWFVQIDGAENKLIQESFGCQKEMYTAIQNDKPIKFYDYDTKTIHEVSQGNV